MKAGHIRQRSAGSFELRWRAGGKVRTETIKVKSRRAAEVELAKRIAQAEGGIVANAPARMTLGDYLPQWVAGLDLKPVTRQNYASTVRTYLAADLGHLRLKELSASAIRTAFMEWHAAGAARSSLRQVKVVLQSCLRSALLDDLIAVNPMDKLRARKGEKNPLPIAMPPKAVPVSPDKIAELLAADGGHYQIAVVLMVGAGLRRGESLGLRWRNVDLDAGRIKIVEQRVPLTGGAHFAEPKSASSARTIKLPTEAIEALREHWRSMATALLAVGIRLTEDHTVACNALGEPLDPNAFGSWARRRGFKLHNLRHAHLSKLVNSGVPIAAVSARAGHSTIATTLGTYVHAEDADDEKAATVAGGFW
jgi:integrase